MNKETLEKKDRVQDMTNRNYVFVHIPKTAGRSVHDALEVKFMPIHKTLQEYADELGPDFVASRFKFAVVRNPWERSVSFYKFFYWPMRGVPVLSFEEWLKRRMHFLSRKLRNKVPLDQLSYCRINGVVAVDELLRFEDVTNQFQTKVASRLGITTPLPHVVERLTPTKAERHEHYPEYFQTQETIDWIGNLNRELIERMNYTF